MKKFLVVMLVCLTVLQTGCIYQGRYRPSLSDDEVWVCENPRMEFYFGEEKREREDVIFINEKKHFIIKHPDAGPIFTVEERDEEDEVDPYVDRENPEKFLFRGEADYKKIILT